MARVPVLLIISVDTEGDAWTATRKPYPAHNLRRMPRLASLFERLGLRCSWLANWQAVHDPFGAEFLREQLGLGRSEVGAHVHPWDNPPFELELNERHTMMCNLPQELQAAKIGALVDAFEERLEHRPTTFRAGRWGLGPQTVRALIEAGFRVDTSVTPYRSWTEFEGPDYCGAPLVPYHIGDRNPPTVPDPEGDLIEIPMSSGYSRAPFALRHELRSVAARLPKGRGVVSRLGVARPVFMSPEMSSAAEMLALADGLLDEGAPHLQVQLHSQSLTPGLTPFARTEREVDRMHGRIEDFVAGISARTEVRFATLDEAAGLLAS
jgi:hypothetical protein